MLDFDATLTALMGRLGERVRVSVYSDPELERPYSQVVDVEGELSAGWDPDVLEANGAGDAAIFRMADVEGFTLYLLREDFDHGKIEGDRIYVNTGGVSVMVGPPFGTLR